MDKVEKKRLAAGLPPWLFVALLLLVFRLPDSVDSVRASFNDFEVLTEATRIQLNVEQIDDGSWLFPADLTPLPSLDEMSMQQMEAWLKERRQEDERRLVLLREWLMGGALTRFRSTAAHALAEIEQAKYLDEERKALHRTLVYIQQDLLAQNLERLTLAELVKLAKLESGLEPPRINKADIIDYLIELDQERRSQLSLDWKPLQATRIEDARPASQEEKSGKQSIHAWRLRYELFLATPTFFFVIDLPILLIPIVGLFAVVFPHLRGVLLERQKGLREHSGEFPEIDEIQAFVTSKAPLIEVRVNLLRPGFAFVYPKGYRRPRLAVLGGMYALWRRDPERAKSLLLHEIEHVRQGDYLLVGYGSFFPKYIKWLLVGFATLLFIHFVIGMMFSVGIIGFHLDHFAESFWRQTLLNLSLILAILFLLISRIIVPLMGIWALELNADYGVIRERTLQLQFENRSNRLPIDVRRIWATLTHPPLWLRTWLAKKDDLLRNFLRQLIFPISFLLAIVMYVMMVFLLKVPSEGLRSETMLLLIQLSHESFASMYWFFGVMAAIVLFWPYLAGYWESFFVGERRLYRGWDSGRVVAAVFIATLGALAWLSHISS